MKRAAKKGKAIYRKQWLYSLAGVCTKKCLSDAIAWAFDQEGKVAKNVCVPGTGLKNVCKAYFPTLEPADQIFV